MFVCLYVCMFVCLYVCLRDQSGGGWMIKGIKPGFYI